jgi:hypothetical protein
MDERRSGAVVALQTAVRRIFAVVYGDEPASAERLAALARAVAALVPVYRQDASGELRPLADQELRDGTVRLADVLVSRTSVEHAIEMLKGRDEPSPQPPEIRSHRAPDA